MSLLPGQLQCHGCRVSYSVVAAGSVAVSLLPGQLQCHDCRVSYSALAAGFISGADYRASWLQCQFGKD